jgi:hypothetical protein
MAQSGHPVADRGKQKKQGDAVAVLNRASLDVENSFSDI